MLNWQMILSAIRGQFTGYHYKAKATGTIERFKELFESTQKNDVWLELVSSLLFLKKHYPTLDEKKLRENLLQRKANFRKKSGLVEEAMQLIKKI